METRCLNQIKIWKLMLNNMTGQCEYSDIVVMSADRYKVEEYYESTKVEMYKDDRWNKQFKKGSLAEWFNDENLQCDKFMEEWVDESFFYGELQEDERFMDGNRFVVLGQDV